MCFGFDLPSRSPIKERGSLLVGVECVGTAGTMLDAVRDLGGRCKPWMVDKQGNVYFAVWRSRVGAMRR